MYKEASKLKLRFQINIGNITVEDLWDLPLTSTIGVNLDDVAKAINSKIRESSQESFVVKNKKNEILELKFSIIKDVIKSKIEEIEQKENEVAIKNKNERILNIIAEKEDAGLKNKSILKLKEMLE